MTFDTKDFSLSLQYYINKYIIKIDPLKKFPLPTGCCEDKNCKKSPEQVIILSNNLGKGTIGASQIIRVEILVWVYAQLSMQRI